MKTDRELIELSKTKSLKALTGHFQRPSKSILTKAKRLGPSIKNEDEGEMSEPHLVDPTPELPDDTPIDHVRFPTRIRTVLAAAGLNITVAFLI